VKCLYPIADLPVHQFTIPVIGSNMYLLVRGHSALVIDPHICAETEKLLQEVYVQSCIVLLTHEHFDHISGVNRLRQLWPCQVVCTASCAAKIQNAKLSGAMTFSALFLIGHTEREREAIGPWIVPDYTCEADRAYTGTAALNWQGIPILLKEMQGHSEGSQIIEMGGRHIFTGDNLIPGNRVITRLPGGSRAVYERQVKPYLRALPDDSIIYPGHGEAGYITSQGMRYGLEIQDNEKGI
jgi:hydroxyacylglutathione hydrolase